MEPQTRLLDTGHCNLRVFWTITIRFEIDLSEQLSIENDNPNKRARRSSYCMSTTLTVEGMTCGHCEQTVEEALEAVSGVTDATANRDVEQVNVEGDANVPTLVQAVEDAGYTAHA